MKKAFKSALSLLLCMIMVVSAFPISTFAEEGTDIDSDLAYSTGNAMGKIVNNLALQESERKSDDYCIADTVSMSLPITMKQPLPLIAPFPPIMKSDLIWSTVIFQP